MTDMREKLIDIAMRHPSVDAGDAEYMANLIIAAANAHHVAQALKPFLGETND